ncbi:hypothetical protein B0A49_03642 [Cryomyces minteri]|uniref:Uncharacterized protein n=1 Tax=Cryomyces minteri TaxID=331657 RepID=A0A4U0XQG4_9PEZI|nr:hypothetical protein B0A49_03642 [Cryomyces minteri]
MADDHDFLNQPSPYHDTDTVFKSPSHRLSTDRDNTYPVSPSSFKMPKSPFKFKKVRFLLLRTSTEDNEDKIEDETHESLVGGARNGPKQNHILWAIFVLLLLSILLNLAFVLRSAGEKQTHQVKFEEVPDFSNVFHANDHLWEELMGGSGGAIHTSENLFPPQIQTTRWFHQLHCLMGIRSAIQQLQAGKKIGYSEQTDIILCNADDTIETSHLDDGGQWTISGYGVKRQCRNNKRLYDLTACGEDGCPGKRYYYTDKKKSDKRGQDRG